MTNLSNENGTAETDLSPESRGGTSRRWPDLEFELFTVKNPALAGLTIVSALVTGEDWQREEIIRRVTPDHFEPRLLPRFLFIVALEYLREHGKVAIPAIEARIPEYGPTVFGEESNEMSLRGHHLIWNQILNLNPTPAQVEQAIEIRRRRAIKKGWISEQESGG